MRAPGVALLVFLGACSQGKSPVGPQYSEDGGSASACESIQETVEAHYERAAIEEEVALNLRPEFVEANVHMVMVDCKANPAAVISCVNAADSAKALETDCLAPLDEAGEVEGKTFSRK